MTRVLLALCACLWACDTIPDVVHPPGPPTPQEAGDERDCPAACANLERLGCPGWRGSPGRDEAYGTEDDVSCAQACVDIVTSDPEITLWPRCTAEAASCTGVDACFGEE